MSKSFCNHSFRTKHATYLHTHNRLGYVDDHILLQIPFPPSHFRNFLAKQLLNHTLVLTFSALSEKYDFHHGITQKERQQLSQLIPMTINVVARYYYFRYVKTTLSFQPVPTSNLRSTPLPMRTPPNGHRERVHNKSPFPLQQTHCIPV